MSVLLSFCVVVCWLGLGLVGDDGEKATVAVPSSRRPHPPRRPSLSLSPPPPFADPSPILLHLYVLTGKEPSGRGGGLGVGGDGAVDGWRRVRAGASEF